MKRAFLILLILLLAHGCACAEYWTDITDIPVTCCDDRPGCQVLQTVMMGGFADFDPDDSLNLRVFSTALPRLAAVTEGDIAHFAESYGVDPGAVREFYYTALANCLRSDIIVNPLAEDMDAHNARIVLGLFLNPGGEDAAEQMRLIRENSTKETLRMLAEHAQLPLGFVERLVAGQQAD